jgi:uncharacterized protein YdhG (YjbR/CyaY superfamily)
VAENKTKLTDASVADFLDTIADPQKREDCRDVAKIMESATKAKGRMWGSSIVGFGESTTVYADGREAEWMLIGFSPRKQNITLYLGGLEKQTELLDKLGVHDCGKGCLYVKRLSDVHVPTLTKLVKASVERKKKPSTKARPASRSKGSR